MPQSARSPLSSEVHRASVSVPLLRWPEEEATRRDLAERGLPRLLVIGATAEAPVLRDELEDWLRDPPDPIDLVARIASLDRRARRHRARPRIDDDGLLWHDERWVVIPDGQLGVAALLLEHANELVRTERIAATYVASGGSGHRATVKTMLNRLRGRFAEVGVTLEFVRGKGVILELATARAA